MARYLVTGAAGFIGSRVSELLLEDGHEVLGVDELNDAYDVRLKDYRRARLEAHAGFRFARLDIAEPGALEEAAEASGFEAFDALVNLAARAGVRASVERPAIYVATNVAGSLQTLELCRRRGIPKYLLASTSSLYGADNPRPFREDADTSRPLSPYAATKGGAEALAYSYHALHGIDVSVLRYFTVYGPAGRPDMSVFRFVQRIREGRPILLYGDGRQSRDFTYVDDIARGTVAALRPLGFEVVNLGGDEPHEVNELIRLVEERVGRKAEVRREPRHPADVPATWADIAKAEKLLGWRPAVAFAEGIARSVAWYEAERRWARDVETG
jgi:nucleoside-diphosphate-sugar epimerase